MSPVVHGMRCSWTSRSCGEPLMRRRCPWYVCTMQRRYIYSTLYNRTPWRARPQVHFTKPYSVAGNPSLKPKSLQHLPYLYLGVSMEVWGMHHLHLPPPHTPNCCSAIMGPSPLKYSVTERPVHGFFREFFLGGGGGGSQFSCFQSEVPSTYLSVSCNAACPLWCSTHSVPVWW
jgi:hypothetical protein